MKSFLILLLISINPASRSEKSIIENQETWWVNSYKVDCEGMGSTTCFLMKNAKDPHADWTYFYSQIEGFEYHPGRLYKIVVEREKLDPARVTADASSLACRLIDVLEVQADPTLRLNDIWAIVSAMDREIGERQNTEVSRAYLEINIRDKRLLGSDGCNTFEARISKVSADNISIESLESTTLACPDLNDASAINAALDDAVAYRLDGLKLYFLDEVGSELMILRKID